MKNYKNLIILTIIAMAVAVVSCKKDNNNDNDNDNDNDITPTGVVLDRQTASMAVNDTLTLVATVQPTDANNEVTWQRSNPSLAIVVNGTITARAVGSANITVTTVDGNKAATCIVTVTPQIFPVDSVTLNQTTATMTPGQTLPLTATVWPANASNKAVLWSTSDTAIAIVSNIGVVTARAVGPAVITVTTQDGNKTAICNIEVTIIPVDSIRITPAQTAVALEVGQESTFTAFVLPANATDRTIVWSSSDPTVATVVNGKITAVSLGTAIITVAAQDGSNVTNTREVTVVLPNRCNINTPGWGNDLGTVGFATTTEFPISGNGITQIWSDAVTAIGCQKTAFSGSGSGNNNFNADCRSNPDYPGDLFSWCAIIRFQDVLCPGDWRVPTTQDYINLDIAFGGDGTVTTDLDRLDRYINEWGGAYGGFCVAPDRLVSQGATGFYWSQTEHNAAQGNDMFFFPTGIIAPQRWEGKLYGLTLRCVK